MVEVSMFRRKMFYVGYKGKLPQTTRTYKNICQGCIHKNREANSRYASLNPPPPLQPKTHPIQQIE